MKKVEALLDSIANLNRALDPESECYKLRNPLLIKSFAKPGKHPIDEKGRREFSSYLNGYKAALFDIEVKISGKSRANVGSESELRDLLMCYDITDQFSIKKIVNFLRRALGDQNITENTPVSYFVGE